MSTWTTISDSRVDADSPVTESLVTDLRENTEYNHERAVRSGTHGAGVRVATAKGRTAFSDTTDGSGDVTTTASITYSTDADDSVDPNFSANVRPVWSLEEDSSGGNQAWVNFTSSGTDTLTAYVLDGTADDGLGFNVSVVFGGGAATTAVAGFINWKVEGTVASGE